MSVPAQHEWLAIHHGDAPLIVSFPHTGTEIPADIEGNLVSPWLARKDADYWVDVLYDFAHEMGATTLRTALSRTVIDVNRDPSGASLYPGQATTGLCPLETFDGEPLYPSGREPDAAEIDTPPHDLLRAVSRRPRLRASSACAPGIRAWCCSTRTRSARTCRACSKETCRSSTSAPTTAPPAMRR